MWHLASPISISGTQGRGQGNHLQPKKSACSPSFCVGYEEVSADHGRSAHTTDIDITVFPLYVHKTVCTKSSLTTLNLQKMSGLWAPISDGWHNYDLCHPSCNGNHHLESVGGPFCLITNKCSLLCLSQRTTKAHTNHTC